MLLPHCGRRPQVAASAYIAPTAVLVGDVVVAEEASIWFNAVVRGDINFIRIGQRSNIQDGTVIHVTRQTHPTVLGEEVTVGHNVTLHGCTVGDRCLIGMGAVVLDGSEIGEESIIAAGSVVAPGTVVPPRTLAVGTPARPKRGLLESEIQHLRQSADNYARYAREYLAGGGSV